jgi:multiple sugar transport system ATP-binding protein
MASVRVEKLRKTFGRKNVAVNDLSFEVADQEFVFLLGPSGAGKTTTLRMIAGLEQPDIGSVEIGNVDVTGASPRERNVAMVYDKNSLYPHLTVFENMAYPLRLRKMPLAEMNSQIERVSKILRIDHLLERRSVELSGGQQQRVAIGRMLVKKADIYLMDEPISHLDAKLRAHMRLEFKKLQKEFKATILYVSHDQLEAMTMGDRVVVMNEGSIQQVGKPRDIFERPANRFVAGFVGEPSMNIVDGAIKLREGRPSVGFANQILRLPADAKLQADGAIAIGVRPQHIQVTNESGDNVIFGKVYAAETLGSETIVDVQVDGKLLRALVKNKDVGDLNTEMGARIGLYINPHAIYLFDSTSGLTTTQADLRKITHG